MKYKQLHPKYVRSMQSINLINKENKRCLLCDTVLKSQRYFLLGKSINEIMIINNKKTITYEECLHRYINENFIEDTTKILCLKCCERVQKLYLLHLDVDELKSKLRQTYKKTKRLNKIRNVHSNKRKIIDVKTQTSSTSFPLPLPIPHETNVFNHSGQQYNLQSLDIRRTVPSFNINSSIIPAQIFPNEIRRSHSPCRETSVPYAQFLIDSPLTLDRSDKQQITDSNNDQLSCDEEPADSPCDNDDTGHLKIARLNRRQYDFLTQLPDQQSLNAFIETSSSESGSRWTWRRTSANSRGYKIYYVCNFSMRRHYHPCPAAIYALFNPEGTISIYSYGKHQHIPKNRLPLTITDESKEEIFKCLQAEMSASDIREHLTRLNLPFGDTKKLNNFIKYHKELLRFGAVTNVRLNGTAYRQPQCWAVRRPSPINQNIPKTLSL